MLSSNCNEWSCLCMSSCKLFFMIHFITKEINISNLKLTVTSCWIHSCSFHMIWQLFSYAIILDSSNQYLNLPHHHFYILNTLRQRQHGRHFPDDILKFIFLNENISISIKISLKFVLRGPINNMSALVQIMAWRRLGDKPLSEPMVVRFLTHICVTQPQWVNP